MEGMKMEALLEISCGLDVHKEEITACLLTGALDTKPSAEIRTFNTMSSGLQELKEWLENKNCNHIAMESTGVYWIAPYEVLESVNGGDVQLMVVNLKPQVRFPQILLQWQNGQKRPSGINSSPIFSFMPS
jgi:hypothetical protein